MRYSLAGIPSLYLCLLPASFLLGVLFCHKSMVHPKRSEPETVVIVTVATEDLQVKYAKQIETHRSYAERHGYTFFQYASSNRTTAYWEKLAALSQVPRHDYYVFLDADSPIVQPSFRAESLFRKKDSVVFSGSPGFSSSHFVALRDDEIGKAFLAAWSRGRKATFECHYDQSGFLYAMVGSLQRYMYGANHTESRKALAKCAQTLNGEWGGCNMYQTCLNKWARKWFCPYTNRCCEGIPRSSSWELRRSARSVPFRWQCNFDFTVSWQGKKETVFEEEEQCTSFSIHPVKRWDDQMKCQI